MDPVDFLSLTNHPRFLLLRVGFMMEPEVSCFRMKKSKSGRASKCQLPMLPLSLIKLVKHLVMAKQEL